MKVIRAGALKASVWRNPGDRGAVFFSVTFVRSYKDGEDWKETQSYGGDDVLALAWLAQAAYSWIQREREREREAKREQS